jgi:hypothetical protein
MRPQLLDRAEAEVVQRGPVGVHEPVLAVADGDRLADEFEQLGELRTLASEDPLTEWELAIQRLSQRPLSNSPGSEPRRRRSATPVKSSSRCTCGGPWVRVSSQSDSDRR